MTEAILAPCFRAIVARSERLSLIDDGACALALGGNKARKLLHGLLEEARKEGAERLFTCGASGSHHVLATAIHGARAGFEVHAALWAQPESDHVRAVREAGLAAGLVTHDVRSTTTSREFARLVRTAHDKRTFVIPLGGSTPRSLDAHASATRALVAAHPELAHHHAIVVPFGSGGTALGIALGLAQALGDRGPCVHAVSVSNPPVGSTLLAARLLARAVAGGLVTSPTARQAWRKLHVDGRYVGAGYGHATPEAREASTLAAALGLTLEVTYTAKAFAAAIDLARRGARAAYWATLGRAEP